MEQELINIISNKVLHDLDTTDLIKKLKPQIMKKIEKSLMDSIYELSWDDVLYEIIGTKEVQKALKDMMIERIKNGK